MSTTPSVTPAQSARVSWFQLLTALKDEGISGLDKLSEIRKNVFLTLAILFLLAEIEIALIIQKPLFTSLLVVSILSVFTAGFILYKIWDEVLLAWETGIGVGVAINDPALVQQKVPQIVKAIQVTFATSSITYLIWLPLAVMILWLFPTAKSGSESIELAYLLPIIGIFMGLASLASDAEGKFTLHLSVALALGIIVSIFFTVSGPTWLPVWIPTLIATMTLLIALESVDSGTGKATFSLLRFIFSWKGVVLAIVGLMIWYFGFPEGFEAAKKRKIAEHQKAGTIIGRATTEPVVIETTFNTIEVKRLCGYPKGTYKVTVEQASFTITDDYGSYSQNTTGGQNVPLQLKNTTPFTEEGGFYWAVVANKKPTGKTVNIGSDGCVSLGFNVSQEQVTSPDKFGHVRLTTPVLVRVTLTPE